MNTGSTDNVSREFLQRQIAAAQAQLTLVQTADNLKASDGSSIFSTMTTDREYVDLKIEASEARAEARFAELNGKLDRLADGVTQLAGAFSELRTETREGYRSTRLTVLTSVIGTGLALAALLTAIVTYGDAIFSRGMQVRDVVNTVIKETEDRRSSQPAPAPSPQPQRPNG